MEESASIIKALEEKLLDPAIRNSPGEVSLILSDDFVEIGSSGKTYTKADVLGTLISESLLSITISDFNTMQPVPDVVLAAYIAVKTDTDGNVSKSLRSSVWKLINGRWQIVFHKGTPLKNG